MGGEMGAMPAWYPLVRAARAAGLPVYPAASALEMPQWWLDKLVLAEAAEAEARAMIADLAEQRRRR
jgi:hypothetical protein